MVQGACHPKCGLSLGSKRNKKCLCAGADFCTAPDLFRETADSDSVDSEAGADVEDSTRGDDLLVAIQPLKQEIQRIGAARRSDRRDTYPPRRLQGTLRRVKP